MEFRRFDSSGCEFPKPKVPVLPGLGMSSLQFTRSKHQHSGFRPIPASLTGLPYARGRYALLEAYRLSDVGKQGRLLAPAFHCRTMIDPALRLGAAVDLYPVKPDLTFDIDAIEAAVRLSPTPVKAVLATHYFGFQQSLADLAEFCTRSGITLIEDCSHALFVPGTAPAGGASAALGTLGRFAVASPYKFFPCEDGGLLWGAGIDSTTPLALHSAGWLNELRGLLGTVNRSAARTSPPTMNRSVQLAPDQPMAQISQNTNTGQDVLESNSAPSAHYVFGHEGQRSLRFSRWVTRHTDVQRLAERRRQHYLRWIDAVADLPNCRALFPTLGDGCVPYMFPLVIDHPQTHFHALKHLGVPIWRWDDMAISSCAVAADYRLRLLHLPCHQELTDDQLHWMTAAVQTVMRASAVKC